MMLLCILLPDGAAAQGGQAGAEEREDGLEDEQLRVRHGFDAEDGEGEHMLIGAFDEETPSQHRIMERMGAFRNVACGEGALFAIVGARRNERSIAEVAQLAFPGESLTQERVAKKYATTERTHIIYNGFAEHGLFPTASAMCFAEAVKLVAEGTPEVVIYNEYFGASPTVIVVRCLA